MFVLAAGFLAPADRRRPARWERTAVISAWSLLAALWALNAPEIGRMLEQTW